MLPYILLAALPLQALAQVTGTAGGFATGVTGGGSATPATPSDTAELEEWLTDDTPRVIMLDKTYDFLEAEGTATETGCVPDSNTCGSSGQNALDGPNWCSASYPSVEITYYVAPTNPIDIKGDKSIVGVGDKGVIRGKGIRLVNNATNVIIQNVHFTELNPQYIWGGDAIQMSGTDLVWIDHCKFSLIGRQMIVSGYETAGRVTISNNEFDGQTSWSASCNGEHYWTMLFLGAGDQITLANNYIHDVSGRAPKLGSDTAVTLHAVNNYFSDSLGHNFDIDGANVLMEGNVFDNCTTPILEVVGNLFNVPDSSAASTCSSTIGRACIQNSVTDSGTFDDYTDSGALSAFSSADNIWSAIAVDKVASSVLANAGIGKLDSSSSGTTTASSAAVATSSSKATSLSTVVKTSSSAAATKAATSAAATKAATTAASTKVTASTSTKAAAEAAVATTSAAASSSGTLSEWSQCGGANWSGSGSCASGLTCKEWNDWYFQCVSS